MNIQSLCHSESVSAITFVKCPISHQGEKDKLRGLCDSTSNKLSQGGRCAFHGSRRCRPGWWARLGDPVSVLSRVQLFATLWTVALRLLCPWDSPSKNTGVGCHALLQGVLPDPGFELVSPVAPASAGGFFSTVLPGKSQSDMVLEV